MGTLAAVRQWCTNFVEHEGLARLTVTILALTSIFCLAYTWGYYEGVSNTSTQLTLLGSVQGGSVSAHGGHDPIHHPIVAAGASKSHPHRSDATLSHSSSQRRKNIRHHSRARPPQHARLRATPDSADVQVAVHYAEGVRRLDGGSGDAHSAHGLPEGEEHGQAADDDKHEHDSGPSGDAR